MTLLKEQEIPVSHGEDEVQQYLQQIRTIPRLTADEERELAKHIEDLWNSTRMLINRGFTQKEFVLKNNQGQDLIEEDNIINFAEAKKNKIYPNQ